MLDNILKYRTHRIYDLAEYFNVTEEFIRNAFYIHEVSGELNDIKTIKFKHTRKEENL